VRPPGPGEPDKPVTAAAPVTAAEPDTAAAPVTAAEPAGAGVPGGAAEPAVADEPAAAGEAPDHRGLPLRVSTLELFFDLVFAITLTQLTVLLARSPSLAGTAQVLLIFGLLWWMYGGYAWLTNTRPPARTVERLLLLVGMAGFLTVGLAIPDGFGRDGSTLGFGYLVVVLVHSALYFRVNRNIVRIAPFSIASAVLVTIAGLTTGPGGTGAGGYALWIAALAVQLGSPLIVHPKGLFEIRPAHFVERHGALLIVALGESVAAISAGEAGLGGHAGQLTPRLVVTALLGLALAACLWWTYFGAADDDRAEHALTAASSERRTGLALSAYFYAHIPLLLGVIAVAAGVRQAIEDTARPSSAAAATTLAAGVALFLAGSAAFRRLLRTGPARLRVIGAVLAPATVAVGVGVTIEAQLAVLTAGLAGLLAAEGWLAPQRQRAELRQDRQRDRAVHAAGDGQHLE
jgi:low temperature requirement protein LtrA